LRQGHPQMDALGNIPKRRHSIRWGAVAVSFPLSAVAGYVAIGRWRRAVALLAAEVLYFALAAAAEAKGKPYVLYAVILVAILHALIAILDVTRLSRYPASQPDFAWALAAGLGAIFFTAALIWAFQTYAAESYRATSGSMLPTIEAGDHLLVSKLTGRVGRGDIIVFQLPTDPNLVYVQRVAAVGGDIIASEEADVLVNGQAARSERIGVEQRMDPVRGEHTVERWRETTDGKTYIIYRRAGPIPPLAEEKVPEGHFYVLGDNRDQSNDSRSWGMLGPEFVKGRALFIWWSTGGAKGVRWERLNKPLQ
jgi:signal peptidase I